VWLSNWARLGLFYLAGTREGLKGEEVQVLMKTNIIIVTRCKALIPERYRIMVIILLSQLLILNYTDRVLFMVLK
jgi:hypothetical protein